MNKPNVCTTSVGARFTEANNHLKAVLECIDSIRDEPNIPDIRRHALAHVIDKVENLQVNLHTLQMQMAHLLLCKSGCRACDELGAR